MSKVVERGEGGCVVLGVWVVWEGMVSLLSKDGRMMFSRTRCVIVYEYYVFFFISIRKEFNFTYTYM